MIYFPHIQVILEKHLCWKLEIDTGDSLPITQKPYTLPLKQYHMSTKRTRNIGESWSNSEKHLTLG